MTLPAAGVAISLGQVNTELSLGATALITLNDTAVRTLFAIASGAISMDDGHGKSAGGGAGPNPSANATFVNGVTTTPGYDARLLINPDGTITSYAAVYSGATRYVATVPVTNVAQYFEMRLVNLVASASGTGCYVYCKPWDSGGWYTNLVLTQLPTEPSRTNITTAWCKLGNYHNDIWMYVTTGKNAHIWSGAIEIRNKVNPGNVISLSIYQSMG